MPHRDDILLADESMPHRDDILLPDESPTWRDSKDHEKGAVIGPTEFHPENATSTLDDVQNYKNSRFSFLLGAPS